MGTTKNAVATPAAETAPAPKELGPRAAFRAQRVMLVATTNPKKPNSASHARFEGYFDKDVDYNTATVGSLLDRKVVRMDDIKNDADKGYIVVGQEAIDAHLAAAETARLQAIEDARALLASVEA